MQRIKSKQFSINAAKNDCKKIINKFYGREICVPGILYFRFSGSLEYHVDYNVNGQSFIINTRSKNNEFQSFTNQL